METKGKGKAITGIAMAAIMLASVFVAMIGTTGAYSDGGEYNIILNDSGKTVQPVLIGQGLNFTSGWGEDNIVTIYRAKDQAVVWTRKAGGDNTLAISGDDWKKEGAYYVNLNETAYPDTLDVDARLSFSDPDVPLTLKVGTKEVSTLTVGTDLIVDTSGMNLFENDTVRLVIMKGDSQMKIKDDQVFDPITVENLTEEYGRGTDGIDTTNFKVGTYTFQIKTKPAEACGLAAESAVKNLKVIKGEIAIEAETTSVVELEAVRLTVTGVAGDNITVEHDSTPRSKHVIFRGGIDDTPGDATNWFDHDIDSDGTRTYSVKFNETGSYTIKVNVTDSEVAKRIGDYDTVDITVTEKGVIFDLPVTLVIGEKFTMTGTADTGTTVDIFVDGKLYTKLDDLILEDGVFSEELTAGSEIGMSVPGSVRLKAWIDCPIVGSPDGTTYPAPIPPVDGDTAVLLVEPGLTAEVGVETVAQEDSFYVKGTAKGARSVDVITVSPKGASGKGIDPSSVTTPYAYPGLTRNNPSISEIDDSFSQRIVVDENANTGTYLVAVLYKGRDGHFGTSTKDTIIPALVEEYGSLTGKTQEQVLAMLVDITTTAGSDDLIWLGKIKVEGAKVTLDTIADVAIGEPLAVAGTTNREDGHIILITVKGPVEITPKTVSVENGTFSATFDTTEAVVGTYTVMADDGDGHTDTVDVEILEEIVPTPTPAPTATAKPTATPAPTPVATAEPTPTPTEEPGFEAVFAIAGLLSIAYLVLRRRK